MSLKKKNNNLFIVYTEKLTTKFTNANHEIDIYHFGSVILKSPKNKKNSTPCSEVGKKRKCAW